MSPVRPFVTYDHLIMMEHVCLLQTRMKYKKRFGGLTG